MSSTDPIVTQQNLIGSGKRITINQLNWASFSYFIEVEAYIGYSDRYLWIHYRIKGEHFKAVYREDQDPVWQDSCVEFFIKQGDI